MSGLDPRTPRTVGIVGSAGAYGRWLCRFFQQHLQLQVIGHDPADPDSHTPEHLLAQADVLVFSAPIRHTPALIAELPAAATTGTRRFTAVLMAFCMVAPHWSG